MNNATDVNLNLRETIPGFMHGLKGMKKGEKRVIYIHPALAYGVHTYLEKGIYLKAIVKLHEIYDVKGKLPLLLPLDFSFIRSDQFHNQCEEQHEQALRFIGMKKSQFLRSCPEIDIDLIAKHLQAMSNDTNLSQEESDNLNQFFWNLYFVDRAI